MLMKRWMLCVLAAVLFLTAACGKTAEAGEEADGVTGILTGVFREKARYAFGEDSNIPLGSVYCSGDSGALTVFEYRSEYNGDSDRTVLDARLRTVGADGKTVRSDAFYRSTRSRAGSSSLQSRMRRQAASSSGTRSPSAR